MAMMTAVVVCIFPFLYFLYAVAAAIPHIIDVTSVSDILVVLLFGMSFREHMPMMTGVGLYFPLFFAASTKPHIVDVTSVSDILVVVVLHLLLQWGYQPHLYEALLFYGIFSHCT